MAYSSAFDSSIDVLARRRIDTPDARAVDHVVVHNCLGGLRGRLRRLFRVNGLDLRHVGDGG